MQKKLLGLSAAAVIVGSLFGGRALTSAQSTTKATGHHHIRWNVRLNQAVRDGTITSAQETAFKAELATIRSERKAVITKSSTKDERQAEHAKLTAELDSWANTNDFPLAKIAPKLAEN